MTKLTKEELRIIEETKQQAHEIWAQKKPEKWAPLLSMLIFVVIFVLLAFAAYVVVGLFAR